MVSSSIVYVGADLAHADIVSRRLRTHLDREVETLAGAEDALARLGADRVDRLVVDYRVPSEDPLSLVRDARARRPEVPVVFFTDIGDPETTAEAEEAGVDAFVRKGPGGVDALVETLASVLSGPGGD